MDTLHSEDKQLLFPTSVRFFYFVVGRPVLMAQLELHVECNTTNEIEFCSERMEDIFEKLWKNKLMGNNFIFRLKFVN